MTCTRRRRFPTSLNVTLWLETSWNGMFDTADGWFSRYWYISAARPAGLQCRFPLKIPHILETRQNPGWRSLSCGLGLVALMGKTPFEGQRKVIIAWGCAIVLSIELGLKCDCKAKPRVRYRRQIFYTAQVPVRERETSRHPLAVTNTVCGRIGNLNPQWKATGKDRVANLKTPCLLTYCFKSNTQFQPYVRFPLVT